MKQKILFVLPGFTFGGTVFSTLNMISLLDKSEYDIDVFAMSHQGPVIEHYKRMGINILPENKIISSLIGKITADLTLTDKGMMYLVKGVRKILGYFNNDFKMQAYKKCASQLQDKVKYDYVASCQELESTYFASCFEGPKRVAWFRSEMSVLKTEVTENEFKKARKNYSLFDNIVCVSQTTCDDFERNIPEVAGKLVAIHNIQNVADIEEKASQPIDDFPKNPFVIVSVGRMNPQKRFSAIPHIARQLKERGCVFEWLIIGDGNAFGEYDRTMAAIADENVSDCVKCIGSRLNPYPYIKKAKLLVNTSYVEACPRVVAEAKILKTPCVCADFSSAREFVRNDHDGYVDTIDGIITPLVELISDEGTYNRIKENCNAYSINNDEIYAKLKQVFSK